MSVKALYQKYKDIVPYAVFGILTTLVNIMAYWFLAHPLKIEVMPSTVIAWFLAVLFAYLTNRKWVFHSMAKSAKEIRTEMISFFACRLATGILDWLCMLIFVDLLSFNDVIIKAGANILVIILNYVASKNVIFGRKDNRE
ncbi:MAG TPA: GtrA family protein [Candidatus Cottocaccamicrobium excrementipullorum]|nr:GtrA family protein [Candidatus Cottocaccamicrobium excrementipullorum]